MEGHTFRNGPKCGVCPCTRVISTISGTNIQSNGCPEDVPVRGRLSRDDLKTIEIVYRPLSLRPS